MVYGYTHHMETQQMRLQRQALEVQTELLREQRLMRRNQEAGQTGPDLSGVVLFIGFAVVVLPAFIAVLVRFVTKGGF
jgi:hypothetical protein